MIKLSYEDIIQKIIDLKKLDKELIEKKVEAKLNQLSGLVSKEGAAHIVANELGIKLFDEVTGKMKIGKVLPGMRNVEVIGRVNRKFETRTFEKEDRKGKVGRLTVGDETGVLSIVFWNDMADKIAEIKEGDTIRVTQGYARDNNGWKELHLGDKSKIEINPKGEKIEKVEIQTPRKNIKDLKENDYAELLGTIVQAFEPRFFEVCPECNKRVRQENNFECQQHGHITPDFSFVMNIILDDSTENIRTVFFSEQVLQLLNMEKQQLLQFKDAPEAFAEIKNNLLGTIIKIKGRTTKNQMFDRLEFMANNVDINPNPDEELKRLEK